MIDSLLGFLMYPPCATAEALGDTRSAEYILQSSYMNFVKHIWIFLSAFGVCFAALSWMQEMITQGFWWKGLAALAAGFVLYKAVIKKV